MVDILGEYGIGRKAEFHDVSILPTSLAVSNYLFSLHRCGLMPTILPEAANPSFRINAFKPPSTNEVQRSTVSTCLRPNRVS